MFLKFRIPNNGSFEPTTVHTFQGKLLKELFKAKKALAEHESKVYEKRNILKGILPSKLSPSVLWFTKITVFNTQKMLKQHTQIFWNFTQNLSKEWGHPLFNIFDTVKLFELDIVPPKSILETLVLGLKNLLLEKFIQKVMLAEIDLLLNRLQEQNVSNETISDINIAKINYIKKFSKQSIPKNLITTKKYLKEDNFLAIPFDKRNGIYLMKCHTYKNKVMDIIHSAPPPPLTFLLGGGLSLQPIFWKGGTWQDLNF